MSNPPTTRRRQRSSAPQETWLFFAGFFAGKRRGVFLHALAVTAAHPGTQRHGRFSVAVAQTVGGFEGLTPAFRAAAIHEVELALIALETGGLHAEQADLAPGVPMGS